MRRTLAVILTLLLGLGLAAGDEQTKQIRTLKAVETLDPKTTSVSVRYQKGMFEKLVTRCPDLRKLVVEEHYDFPVDDLRWLAKLEQLRDLEIWGDLGVAEDVFEVLGTLTTVRHMNLALG